jgi:hypothetical protein
MPQQPDPRAALLDLGLDALLDRAAIADRLLGRRGDAVEIG